MWGEVIKKTVFPEEKRTTPRRTFMLLIKYVVEDMRYHKKHNPGLTGFPEGLFTQIRCMQHQKGLLLPTSCVIN